MGPCWDLLPLCWDALTGVKSVVTCGCEYSECSWESYWLRKVAVVGSSLRLVTSPVTDRWLGSQYQTWFPSCWMGLKFPRCWWSPWSKNHNFILVDIFPAQSLLWSTAFAAVGNYRMLLYLVDSHSTFANFEPTRFSEMRLPGSIAPSPVSKVHRAFSNRAYLHIREAVTGNGNSLYWFWVFKTPQPTTQNEVSYAWYW